MFKRMPGSVGYNGDQLGLWEYQSETEATEMIHLRRGKKGLEKAKEEQERPLPNYARQPTWGK